MPRTERIPGSAGSVVIESEGRLVRAVHLRSGQDPDTGESTLAAELRKYFAGARSDFSAYDVDWSPYTPFELSVLKATREIPYGQTRTYGQIAAAIGEPGAARAVGRALGKNRTCIVVPCHRVVAVNGLGGFTGGVRWKRELLALEGVSLGKA